MPGEDALCVVYDLGSCSPREFGYLYEAGVIINNQEIHPTHTGLSPPSEMGGQEGGRGAAALLECD